MRWYLLLWMGCQSVPEEVNPPGENIVVVATAADDFSTGSLSVISLDDWSIYEPITAVSGDPVVQTIDQKIVQINRLGTDTIRVYDPQTWGRPLQEFSVGTGNNPHTTVMCQDEMWVSLYEQAYLARYRNDVRVGTLDLSEWADEDGLPEMSDMLAIDGVIYVALQRLNRNNNWKPEPTGAVIAVDCNTATIIESIEVGPNPSLAQGTDGRLWVTSPEVGLQVLNPDTGLQTVITDFGAYAPEQLAFGTDGHGLVIAHAEGVTGFALFCVHETTQDTTLALETDSYLTDVGIYKGQAWVSARRSWIDEAALGGLMVWDVAACTEQTEGNWIQTALDPVSLTFLP